MKKILSIALVLMMALSMLPMIGSADGVVLNELGKTPVVLEGDVTLTLALASNADILTWDDGNWMTRFMNETLGGKFELDIWPATDASSKLSLMVNSGSELPDIMHDMGANDWAMQNQMADAGAAVDLTEYFEKDNPMSALFYQRCEETGRNPEAVLAQVRGIDGGLYAFPFTDSKIPNIFCNRAYINKDFLAALGMEAPKTIDELTAYLIAVRDNDPNGNGLKDEIPLTGTKDWNSNGNAMEWIQNMFIYKDSTGYLYNRLDNTDGKLDVTYDKPEYREFLKYVNMLVKEGLLDQASFTQDTSTMRVGLQADVQTAGMMCGSANGFGKNIASWDPIEQPVGPTGLQQVTYWKQNMGSTWIISSACENVEAAVLFGMLGYQGDEWQLIMRYGEPGVDWRYAEPDELSVFHEAGIPARLVCLNVTWATPTDKTWQKSALMPSLAGEGTHIEAFDGNEIYGERYHGRSVSMNMKYAPAEDDVIGILRYTEDEQDMWAEARASLKTYIQEARALFAVGQLDPNSDADWENYLNELNNLQYKDIIAVDQAAYDRMYGAAE